MNNKVVVIIQARMQSSRLPRKVLKSFLGKPLLGYLVDEWKDFSLIKAIIELLYKQNSNFGLGHILNLYKTMPKLFDLNLKVGQKITITRFFYV